MKKRKKYIKKKTQIPIKILKKHINVFTKNHEKAYKKLKYFIT